MPYVSVQLSDGLGNRLFQVAACLGYAETHGHTPVFVKEWIKHDTAHAGPKHITDFFPTIPILTNVTMSEWTVLKPEGKDAFTYIDLPCVPGNVKLEGYFQSERYFPKDGIPIPKLLSELELDSDYGSCAFLHVRRGDYLSPYTAHHRVDLMKYYQRALGALSRETPVVICSDDIEWCRSIFPQLWGNCIFLEDVPDYVTLAIMTRCGSMAICANSTFSWWGAYFSTATVKVMPDIWGYPPLPSPVDLYPDWALRLPTA